jgi:hypothetical protein
MKLELELLESLFPIKVSRTCILFIETKVSKQRLANASGALVVLSPTRCLCSDNTTRHAFTVLECSVCGTRVIGACTTHMLLLLYTT